MYVKKREASCKWSELATWGKERRDIFFKYNLKKNHENILPIQTIVLKMALDLENLCGRES